ncbi:methyltransferase domain-containing protein [Paenibacillus sp. MMS18-CY102]|uniref:methyltransferase domain-containing protein n=1 Tax=Paenibacillus sp. MMS18-CY102 TaxID=2682849 RepID=UPI0013666163|nr:methyltransferase domain-containing protein [Paenibacillus sp. MMS18-CY102]MWC30713.1 methyltransferase domain-containing protein [Paenibacillus sp. MMS18-CY102]
MANLQLRWRAKQPELMDDCNDGGAPLRQALQHLGRLNRLFAAAGPILYGVKQVWKEAGRPRELAILDIGCGAGDVNRALLRWAKQEGIKLELTLADITAEACAEAREQFQGDPRVKVEQLDLFQLPAGTADIVVASQVLHHFGEGDVAKAFGAMLQGARLGVVVGDIHRHPIAWAAVWLAARLVSRNRYIRHDGPLSVAKGFRAADWRRMQVSLRRSHPEMHLAYAWRPLFRYACWAKRPQAAEGGNGDA